MFIITSFNFGENKLDSSEFSKVVYDISRHIIMYETFSSIKHILTCDFSSIYDKIHEIVGSSEFLLEVPYNGCSDGNYYEFEYNINSEKYIRKGYVYELSLHEELIDLIESCAKPVLKDEQRLLGSNWGRRKDGTIEQWALDIVKSRQDLNNRFMTLWQDIEG